MKLTTETETSRPQWMSSTQISDLLSPLNAILMRYYSSWPKSELY